VEITVADWGKRWRQFEGDAIYWYQRLVGKTVRWQIEGKDNLMLAQASKRPFLWSLWHGLSLPFIMYGYRFMDPRDFCVVVVGDERSDVLQRLAERIQASTYAVDMGGNPMAAGRAVLRVIQAMKKGKQSMLAPDGPDGPAFIAKPGIAFLARKTEGVVLPVGAWARPVVQIPRWDRYLVPLPLATVYLAFGKPIYAGKDEDETALTETITQALTAVRHRARQMAGVPQP
jgi:lysophospholipid acyltransferase (LPLAT)-like uncharacterized protein